MADRMNDSVSNDDVLNNQEISEEAEGAAAAADIDADLNENENGETAKSAAASQWYVIHTYSGYENNVKVNLEKSVEVNGLQDMIHEVTIPLEEVAEIRNGKRRTVKRKIFPGYVLVKMIMSDKAWYLVRNTRGVTGFVGPESKPVPLSAAEVDKMFNRAATSIDIAVGEEVRILSGQMANCVGVVEDIDTVYQKIKVSVVLFGRDVSIDLEYDQVVRVEAQ
jgi:transcriptional antiterminator NusG